MNKYNKLVSNSVIFAIGNFSSKLITVIMLPFYTSYLSQSDYGQIDLMITTIALLLPLLTLNIVEAVIRFSLDKKKYSYGDVLTNALMFLLFGVLILLMIYPVLIHIQFIGEFVILFYCIFIAQSFHTIIKQFARSINMSKVFVISDILYTIYFVLFNILFIYFFRLGVQGYFFSMIIAYILDLFYLLKRTNARQFIKRKYIDKSKMKLMFLYCIPLIPNNIMWWILNISDKFLITYFLGLSANGLYAVASKFPSIIANFHGVFFNAWQISAVEEYEELDKDEFYSNIFNVFFFLMLIFSSIYMIFNKFIIGMLVADEFYSAWKYAPILVMGVVFSSFSGFIGTNYIAMKKTRGALYTSLFGALTNFILNLILIPCYGIYGASIATMISFALVWLLRIKDTRKYVKINYPIIKMIFALTLIMTQLSLNYFNFDSDIFGTLNIVFCLLLFILGYEYFRRPILSLLRKIGLR